MNMRNVYLFGVGIVFFAASCEDIYYPKEINSTEKIPVIQGIIEDGKVPTVKISWALGYNTNMQDNISGAEVYVSDNLGDSIQLEEGPPGTYTVFSGYFKGYSGYFTGTEGYRYRLRVKLPNGNTYVSSEVPILKKPLIDSLYATPGTRTVYTTNLDNENIGETQQGLYIKADLSSPTDSTLYYRFNTQVVKEMTYTIGVSTPGSHPVYLWASSQLDNNYSVDLTVKHNNNEVIREHNVGYLQYYYDPSTESAAENVTGIYIVGWVLTFNVYSISADVYNYYNSITQQLNSNNQIFAPVPSQVRSTIHCINDPAKKVIGVFEACSSSVVFKAFGWRSLKAYNSVELPFFPDYISGGSSTPYPPGFWVNF
jgi:hypothetical protein